MTLIVDLAAVPCGGTWQVSDGIMAAPLWQDVPRPGPLVSIVVGTAAAHVLGFLFLGKGPSGS